MRFHERLKALREDKDEKQKDIAKLLYVKPSTISSYETGRHFPANDTALITLAKHFDVSLDYLLGYSDIPRYHNMESYADILTACNGLSEENKKLAVDYINYLKSRQTPEK